LIKGADNMNILIAVASKHGSTEEIAAALTEELRAAGLTVDLRDADAVDNIDPYDAVVLGSAIYAGNWLPAARHFAELYTAALAQRPVWVFSSGPLAADDSSPTDDLQRLAAPLGAVPVREHRIFAGKLDKDELGLVDWLIATAVKAPQGDFRDWEVIRAWARGIAAALLPAPAR
jgi:menaquinone-dependent protoporphyrinogen oxidase